ncbi:MAG: AsmA-like C-terminal region-containing protein [Candidatus Acidiferrales bacterium]
MARRVGRIIIWTIAAAAMLCAALSIGLTIGFRGYLKRAVVTVLRERFESDVQIQDIRVFILPRIYVTAQGVVLRHKGRTDVPPLLTADKLEVSAGVWSFLSSPRRIDSVHLEGLQIHVPPKLNHPQPTAKSDHELPASIGEITSDDAVFVMLPKEADKVPLEFDIHHLVLHDFNPEGPADFTATLTNPKPIGEIQTEGKFGPWDADEPSVTPVSGTFGFTKANLGTLKGISGILSSSGKFDGVLDELNVEGDTDTPDFALRYSEKPVDLKTHFVAVVDGTNGNTELKSVTARFLNSMVETSGEIIKTPGAPARHIELDAVARDARVEDLLHLVVKSDEPVMTGSVGLQAKIDLPPVAGEDIFDRLILSGRFGIEGAQFSSLQVQEKVDALSRRGQGQPKNEDIEDVISNLRGQFTLKDRLATFSNLAFDVSGAKIQLNGSYNLDQETLDFSGLLLLNAKLSQTVTGKKSFFLKAIDPFFEKNGAGTSLPIRITGTRSNPAFGLDFNHDDRGKNKDKKDEKADPVKTKR